MTYQYPGEDPIDVLGSGFTVSDTQTTLGQISKGWSHSASTLDQPGAWKGDAASAAAEDAGRLTTILSQSSTSLGKIYTAMSTYSSALTNIRMRVDSLNEQLVKAQALLNSGQGDVRLAHVEQETGDLTAAQATELRGDGTRAIGRATSTMADLDRDYKRIVSDQKTAADTCNTALRTLPDGSTVTTGTNYSAALDKALGLSQLNIVALATAIKDAKALANLKQPLDPNDKDTQAKIKELDAILAAHKGDANFSTPFLTDLGAPNVVKLSGMLATMYHGDQPPAIMSTVGDLEKQFADAVSASTQHVGSVGQPPQLSNAWLSSLEAAGRDTQTFKVDGIGDVTVHGYVPLMAMLGNGSGYSSSFMDALGQDMKTYETEHGGSSVWLPEGTGGQYMQGGKMNGEFPMTTSTLTWDWGPDKNPASDDPFSGWSEAMKNSPASARAVMANDNDLLKYLLDKRDWTNEGESYIQQGSNSGWHHVGDGDGPGLKVFGDMIGSTDDPSDPNSNTVLQNVVTDLGDNKNNPRLSGSFSSSDWVPDGLRSGVATLMSRHLTAINESMGAGNPLLPKTDVEYVLGDVSKNEDAYKTLYQAEAAHAGYTMTAALKAGNADAADLASAYGNVDAWLDHGATVGFAHESQEGAEAHNSLIEAGGSIFKIAAGTAAEAGEGATGTELAGGTVDAGIDKITDGILKQFEVDPTPQINANNENVDQSSNQSLLSNGASAIYASMTPSQQAQYFPGVDSSAHLTNAQISSLVNALDPQTHPGESAKLQAYYHLLSSASGSYNNTAFGPADH